MSCPATTVYVLVLCFTLSPLLFVAHLLFLVARLPGAVWTWRVSPSEWWTRRRASRLICLRSRVLAPALSLRNEITPWLEARISVTSCVLRAAGRKSNLLSVDASKPWNGVGLATFEKTLVVWFLFPAVTSLCSYKMKVTYLSLSGRFAAVPQYILLVNTFSIVHADRY